MIIASEIAPSPELSPFVRCYTYRQFDTKGLDMKKPWHAAHEVSLVFFFNAWPVHLLDPHTGQILQTGSYAGVSGLGSHYNGEMTFNGDYSFFEIYFRPTGFNKIFGIPSSKITNQIINADDIFDSEARYLFERLCEAKSLVTMGILANTYLLAILKSRKSGHDVSLTFLSNLITKNPGMFNVAQLAYTANMCSRNLERYFLEQVGLSPKQFCSVVRFNNALNLKLSHPQKDWTSIAHEGGYFDQMHLIKDFKRFSGNAPSSFLKHTPIAQETYTSRVAT
ncbi:transcriptional regulator, AraC family [Pricia antarctica]|uniref:Transcriptional regulator, AraC family n=1 Tax=Pricia antarctica TaxID=641691 RepID=A0A1G7B9X5_9FLAO|nr:helix-turn-helix domain-containing protein [Pricia antarctica]SDE23762.1 transcriptional regulator, AraC family [Pricia antarctica]